MSKALERLNTIQAKIANARRLKDIADFQQTELENLLAENGYGSIEELESELHDLEKIMQEEEDQLNLRLKALMDEIERHDV